MADLAAGIASLPTRRGIEAPCALVLAISDFPFKDGRPLRPRTPAYERITY